MKLNQLKETLQGLVSKKQKGKKVKRKKVAKILEKLLAKETLLKKAVTRTHSKEEKKDLSLKLKVTQAQISKAHTLLKKLKD